MYCTNFEEYRTYAQEDSHLTADALRREANYPVLVCPRCCYIHIEGLEACKNHVACHFPYLFTRERKTWILRKDGPAYHPVNGVRKSCKISFNLVFKICCMRLQHKKEEDEEKFENELAEMDGGKKTVKEIMQVLQKKRNRK